MNSLGKTIGLLLMPLAFNAFSEEGPHWEYRGEHGPEHWGDLAPEFVQCKVGVNQSPVDIINTVKADLSPMQLHYAGNAIAVVNNGHTLQVNVSPGNFLQVGGEKFELQQFHVHAPSEHQVNGELFLMETHFVHSNDRGELAVVGVLHRQGPFSEKLGRIGAAAPREGGTAPLEKPILELVEIPSDLGYYRYNGSLTTPPCSEGVRWFVLKQASEVSETQQDSFVALIGEDARGPQPVNARIILE